MTKFKVLLILVAAISAIAALAMVTRPAPQAPLVLAASSLQEAMEEAGKAWAAQGHPAPVMSFAATSALARQIEAGAPADLFVAADEEWMDKLAAKGLIQARSRRSFLTNRLVIVAAKDSTTTLAIGPGMALTQELTQAPGGGRLALADPESVPAGKYAKAALVHFGVWDSVKNHIASGENVRAALALVERGQSPLGIVYETDARASARVRVVGVFPDGSHPPITYPLALLASSSLGDAAAFREFLLSADGTAIFRRHGFGTR